MANKKINELVTRTPSLTDLMLVGDPSSGYSYKCTITALATIIETDIADGYVTLGTTQTITGAKTFSNNLTLTSVTNAGVDTDKFLVLNGSNIVNFRTGSEVLSDIGGQGALILTTTGTSGAATLVGNTLNIPQYQGVITLTTTGTSGAATLVGNTLNIPNYAPDLSGYVPTSRTITINGTTQDLTANRTYNVGTVTSVAASAGTGISISGSPITSSGTITITNTAPDQVVALTAGTGISISGTYPNFTITNSSPSLGGTVTSVALSAPTGFSVTGSPVTSSGTLALAFASGYSLPTTASQTNWDSAYNNMIVSAAVTGTTTKTLTLTQQDAGTITASWTDINTDAVTSVFGRTGAVVAANGDYTTAQVTESGNLYFTDARARAAISLTTTGSSGAATYSSSTGVLNIPTYTLAGLGGISLTSLSALAPLSYNNTTGIFSIALATASTDGYLRFQDWNFFADKIGGSGTTNYIPKFTSSSAIGNSQIFDNGTNVGIGTANPSAKLYITAPSVSGTIDRSVIIANSSASGNGSGSEIYLGWNNPSTNAGGGVTIGASYAGAGTNMLFSTPSSISSAPSVKMTLDASGNLGLGVTPSAWNTYKAYQLPNGSFFSYPSPFSQTGMILNAYNDGSWKYYTSDFASQYLQYNGEHRWSTAPSGTAGNAITFTQAMTLNASGNLGLGVTPSAWYSSSVAFQTTAGSMYTYTTDRIFLGQNVYINSSGSDTYYANGAASTYRQYSGSHAWYTAPSGTAGNAISFTQAMTLDASGNLGVGATSNYGSGARLTVQGGPIIAASSTWNNSNAGGAISMFSDNANYGTIWALKDGNQAWGNIAMAPLGGNVGIGTTSPTQKLHIYESASGTGAFARMEEVGGQTAFYGVNTSGGSIQVSGANPLQIATNGSERMRITSGGNVEIATGSIKTGTPSGGTAKPWKLGSKITSSTWAFDDSGYVEVEIDGVAYKLALVTPA